MKKKNLKVAFLGHFYYLFNYYLFNQASVKLIGLASYRVTQQEHCQYEMKPWL